MRLSRHLLTIAALAALAGCAGEAEVAEQPDSTEAAPDGDGGYVKTGSPDDFSEPLDDTEYRIAEQVGLVSIGIDGFYTYDGDGFTCEVNYILTKPRDIKTFRDNNPIAFNPDETVGLLYDGPEQCGPALTAQLEEVGG